MGRDATPAPRVPAKGARVLSASGRLLGYVAEEPCDGAFILAIDGREVRMNIDCVFTTEANFVTLICEREGLSRYEKPLPGNRSAEAS